MYVMIVPEPHLWDRPIKTIPTYTTVMKEIMGQVREIAEGLARYDKLTVIHMGDLFHKSVRDYDAGMDWYDYFCSLDDLSEHRQYTVLGNHELSYPAKNPFWRFVDVKSEFVRSLSTFKLHEDTIRRPIKLVDALKIGNTEFLFWHYGRDVSRYQTDAENVVVLAHQSLIEKEIADILKNKYSRDQLEEILDYRSLRQYGALPRLGQIRYLFVGHMHSAYSRFQIRETMNGVNYDFVLQYLGSLGRTKAIEVRDDDLERTIPVFQLDDQGHFATCDKKIQLPGEEIVSKERVKINREAYHRAAEMRELKRSVQVIESPMVTLTREIEKIPWLQVLVEAADKHQPLPQVEELLKKAEEPLPTLK